MTTKVSPNDDPLFIQLAGALENYCLAKDCTSCVKSAVCQRWFNSVSLQSSLGKLSREKAERHLQTMRDIIFNEAGR